MFSTYNFVLTAKCIPLVRYSRPRKENYIFIFAMHIKKFSIDSENQRAIFFSISSSYSSIIHFSHILLSFSLLFPSFVLLFSNKRGTVLTSTVWDRYERRKAKKKNRNQKASTNKVEESKLTFAMLFLFQKLFPLERSEHRKIIRPRHAEYYCSSVAVKAKRSTKN